jgi:hypothetical protein
MQSDPISIGGVSDGWVPVVAGSVVAGAVDAGMEVVEDGDICADAALTIPAISMMAPRPPIVRANPLRFRRASMVSSVAGVGRFYHSGVGQWTKSVALSSGGARLCGPDISATWSFHEVVRLLPQTAGLEAPNEPFGDTHGRPIATVPLPPDSNRQ